MQNMSFKSAATVASLLLLLAFDRAEAHGIWVAERAGEWAVVLGEGAKDDAYQAEAVTQVIGQAADGSPVPVTVRAREHNVVLDAGGRAATIGVRFVDGYWSEDADGKWSAGSRVQSPGARKVGHYLMFTRTELAPSAQPAKALGQVLEIVPMVDPLALRKGGKLPVLVLFQGQPLAGAALASDYLGDGANRAVRTDRQGRAVVTVRSSGLNVIKVSHTVARADRREADEDGYAATLTFALPPSKE